MQTQSHLQKTLARPLFRLSSLPTATFTRRSYTSLQSQYVNSNINKQKNFLLARSSKRFSTAATFGHPATLSHSHLPQIKNEPMYSYAPGSIERKLLTEAVEKWRNNPVTDIPIVIDGKEYRTKIQGKQVYPFDHARTLATYHFADEKLMRLAVESSLKAKKQWEELAWEARAAIFLKAADLLSTKYRYDVLAATMLGQGKNAWQAEIDAAAEACDFWRFGVRFANELYTNQPPENSAGTWNRTEHRPLEGFVYAVSPFNFTAIGANLASSPAIVGNTVIWKPSPTGMLASYLIYQILLEAGLPHGVINFVPADGPALSNVLLNSPHLAGIHFTGSTATFQHLWKQVGERISTYRTYPRLVGETGGKNFHFVHASADRRNVINQTIRSSFEFSGQKCSACSRMYIPRSLWENTGASSTVNGVKSILPRSFNDPSDFPSVKDALIKETQHIITNMMGEPQNPSTLVSAVIDQASYNRISAALEKVRNTDPKIARIIVGGKCDNSKGYFIEPTIIETTDPQFFTMTTELFGPVLTVYVYPDAEYEKTLTICDQTGPYALTGAIFAQDRYAQEVAYNALRNSAGNFYVNDKCTGAVVGQQPFGGARGSGTNDKAGGIQNVMRWVSPRSIKESFVHIEKYTYPSNEK